MSVHIGRKMMPGCLRRSKWKLSFDCGQVRNALLYRGKMKTTRDEPGGVCRTCFEGINTIQCSI